MKLAVIFLLAASVFAAPCILDPVSHEPSALTGALAVEVGQSARPQVELAVFERENTLSNPSTSSSDTMGWMVMGGVVTLVTMLSTGGTLALSVAFNRLSAHNRRR